ncbi:MAG: methyl-accepting chemotaxis protein [Deltaproteobacteria bacterium]|nr:methyl-accepting chemotaxis protein [Deltaproteobacteria bacterium]
MIEREFKLIFGLKFCLLVIAGVSLAALLLYYFTSQELGRSYGEAFHTIYNIKAKLFPLLFASFQSLLVIIVVTVAIAIISLLFSHKIAGPIFRLERNIHSIREGNLTTNTSFRTGDQIQELAETLNDLTRTLNHRVSKIKDSTYDVKRFEEQLKHLLEGNPSPQEIREAVEGMKNGVKEMQRAIRTVGY